MFIVTKEIDSENISKLCRTCLREDGKRMVCLFVGPAGSSLAAKLRSLSCLEVWQGDGLPEKICDRCVTRAESALLYREQCRAADRALRQAALKVSGLTSYSRVPGSKLYHEKEKEEGFAGMESTPRTLKCIECAAVFTNYQDLCAHSRLHLPLIQENISLQRSMHVADSQNSYLNFNLNFSHFSQLERSNLVAAGDGLAENPAGGLAASVRAEPGTQVFPNLPENSNRPACALYCSLCNHTFTNRMQLMSHSIAHSRENIEISCDNENIEICEDSREVAQGNVGYGQSLEAVENSMQNFSYQRAAAVGGNDGMENLAFSETIELNPVAEESCSERGPDREMHPVHALEGRAALDVSSSSGHAVAAAAAVAAGANSYQAYRLNPSHKSEDEGGEGGRLAGETGAKTRQYSCDACGKMFRQKSKLHAHKLSHTGEQPFKCQSCEKAYASKSKLNAHQRLHTKTNVHQCKICEKIFPYPSYLQDHVKSHERKDTRRARVTLEGAQEISPRGQRVNKWFECGTCNKRFVLAKSLKAHERLHTGKGLYRCDVCDKEFSLKYNLTMHVRAHKRTNLQECEYCGKSFVQKSKLAEHLRIHTRAKPFKCKLCGKGFSQSSHLSSHQASHTTVRQHQCRLCGKRFKLSSHLKRHQSLHSGAKAYKCYQCNQLFSQAFSLTRHLRRHSEANPA